MDAQSNIDNITLIVTCKLVKNNDQKLADVHNQAFENWQLKYRSEFSFANYQVIQICKKQNINYISVVKLKKGH